jgi:hypothetical protein
MVAACWGASACDKRAAWPAGSEAAFFEAVDHADRIIAKSETMIDRWSSAWSTAIEERENVTMALVRTRTEKPMSDDLEAIAKDMKAFSARIHNIHARWTMPQHADNTLMGVFECVSRLYLFASSPTGSMMSFNQSTGNLKNECAAKSMTARAWAVPPKTPSE